MKERYAAELAEGMRVEDVFALRAKELRWARTGEAYLSLELADRSGSLQAVCFRPDSETASVPVGGIVVAKGTVTSFRGVLRLSVESMRPAEVFDRDDLLPRGARDRQELVSRLQALVRKVSSLPLRKLLREVFADEELRAAFAECPGSCGGHHSYIGGLLEHTVSVAEACVALSALYEALDRDLLLAAALLHDIGKVEEISFATSLGYTDAGRMVGHLVLGERRVRRAAERLGEAFPEELALRLSHLLLAHHGELEWGSPTRPVTIEALVLHHADNLDAKVGGFMQAITPAIQAEERWTKPTNVFKRRLLVPPLSSGEGPLAAVMG